jgi:hypothetical protein
LPTVVLAEREYKKEYSKSVGESAEYRLALLW